MIIIVANRWDKTPRSVASDWAPCPVAVLTPQDLSVGGWRQRLSGSDRGTVVAEGQLVPEAEISSVLTLLPCVFEAELVEIAPQDRRYVAAEMTAFLLFWLSRLNCTVLNRPTPTCLSGPYWRREKWVHAAAQAGISVQPARRHAVPPGFSAEEETLLGSAIVTVIGERVIGEVDSTLCGQARCLAALAGVELLSVRFSSPERGGRFVSADTFPDLSDKTVADAVLEHMQGRQATCA
ncbi:MAG: hypothetical protein JO151_19720 [Verrucomicrobia bacterium]|nr:hypothetical protein [Verrucomicrobiota bacterium]